MSRPSRPGPQVCQLCGRDDAVELHSEGPDMWVFRCVEDHGAGAYEWRPTMPAALASHGRTEVGVRIGVYDALVACLQPGERVEFGVVEQRFAATNPRQFAQLVDKYGHRAQQRKLDYTVSVFLAHALGQLDREGVIEKSWTQGTGYWSYLDTVSAWSLPGGAELDVTSWAQIAESGVPDPSGYVARS